MKKILFALFALCCFSFVVDAKTKISHNQKVSGVWTKKRSPYIITGCAIVPKGKTLTIEKGVKVYFHVENNTKYSSYNEGASLVGMLLVDGALIARGTDSEKVIFTKEPGSVSNYWRSIVIRSKTQKSKMTHCDISWGYTVYWDQKVYGSSGHAGTVTVLGSQLDVDHCHVHHNNWNGIAYYGPSKGVITNSLFEHNESGGVDVYNGAVVSIDHCNFHYNQYAVDNGSAVTYLKNSIVYYNKMSMYTTSTKSIHTSYCLLQSDHKAIVKGEGVIMRKNPLFVSSTDYHLRVDSPCADKGEDGTNGEDMGIYPVVVPKKDVDVIVNKNDVKDPEENVVKEEPKVELSKTELVKKNDVLNSYSQIRCGTTFKMANVRFVAKEAKVISERQADVDLEKLIRYLKENSSAKVVLLGHTDFGKDTEALLELSDKRVEAIKKILIENGISENRIGGQYYGGKFPIYKGGSTSLRAQNRRVEFKVLCEK